MRIGRILLILLMIFPWFFHPKKDRGIKLANQYWTETGLDHEEIESIFKSKICYSEKLLFLACVNAINSIAEKYELTLSQEGELKRITKTDYTFKLNEKIELSQWENQFSEDNKISFFNLWQELKKSYISKNEMANMVAIGLNGYLSVANDPHTYLMPVAQYEEVIANSEVKQDKAGFVFRRSAGNYLVKKVFKGTAAAKAGLKKSDLIIEVNGENTKDILPTRLNEILKMKSSDRLGLKVLRNGNEKYLELIKTEAIFTSVEGTILSSKKNVGLITIHKFGRDSCESVKKEIISLTEQNMTGLIIDVRDNPGGQLDEAACIAGLFLEQGTPIFETRFFDSSRPKEIYKAEFEKFYAGPLVILINSGSASASEILAGAMKEYNRAKLIGERTFGKGSFQDGRIWAENNKIALFKTEGLYYFPSGWTPQLTGVEPDISIQFNQVDQQREEDLFFNPIKPRNSIIDTYITQVNLPSVNFCEVNLSEGLDDLQIKEAGNYLLCQ